MKTHEKLQLNNYFLYIDTVAERAHMLLFNGEKEMGESIEADNKCLTDCILNLLEMLFLRNKIFKNQLRAILVNPGPGSYTGLRVGLTVANFLAYSLNVPVVATCSSQIGKTIRSIEENKIIFISPVLPVYKNPPHIS